ncbi:hypothetical protein LX36DRAFT_493399 [Colletotrichum falcatum]|nr:hypothetical protein LX36DRAFT_493399 [Colletotrichum falcatum]
MTSAHGLICPAGPGRRSSWPPPPNAFPPPIGIVLPVFKSPFVPGSPEVQSSRCMSRVSRGGLSVISESPTALQETLHCSSSSQRYRVYASKGRRVAGMSASSSSSRPPCRIPRRHDTSLPSPPRSGERGNASRSLGSFHWGRHLKMTAENAYR